MDRHKYWKVMTSLSAGLIAAVFFYIRTELRLNGAVETVSEAICIENLQGPDRADEEESLYAAVGKAMGKTVTVYAAGQDTYMSEAEED